ncbi:MAG: hypothetical protein ACI8WB_001723 [Phenylobacterium sp.]|jgi:hypothetical protein
MPIEQDITALVTSADKLTGVVETKLEQVDTRMDQAEDDLSAWEDNHDSVTHSSGRHSIFVDAINGDDSQAGTSAAPFKTWMRVIDAFTANGLNDVYFCSDMLIDEYAAIWRSPGVVRFFGWDLVNGVYIKRKLTVLNAVGNKPGGMFTRGGFSFYSQNIDYHLAATTSYSLFNIYSAPCAVRIHGAKITASEQCKINLLHLADGSFGNFLFTGCTIDPSATGLIFTTVGAGVDPNSVLGITSDLTSA